MAEIETLVSDIYQVIDEGVAVPEEDRKSFADDLSRIVTQRLEPSSRPDFALRMSNLAQCTRRQWIEKHHPEAIEPLEPHTKLKFLIGDIWEAVLLYLAKLSGHDVQGQQDEVSLHDVLGHRDAVVDGVIIDCKSASPYSFKKFQKGLEADEDSFGYLTQLGGYLEGSILSDDRLVTDRSRYAFLAGDKTLGHVCLDVHDEPEPIDYETLISDKRQALESDVIPPRPYSDVPDGKSGNRRLDTVCSYCPVKSYCWPDLKQYNYSSGPRWLTHVEREPRVDPF